MKVRQTKKKSIEDFCFGGNNWAGKELPTSWHVKLIYRTGLDHEAVELRTNTWQRYAWEHSLGE